VGEEAGVEEEGGRMGAWPEADTGVWPGDAGEDRVLPGEGLGTLTWINGDWWNDELRTFLEAGMGEQEGETPMRPIVGLEAWLEPMETW
jgi:hypothetical protein